MKTMKPNMNRRMNKTMKIEIMIAVLGIICIGSLAAAFVLWAKIDEQKQKTADEHANYLAALNLHNAAADAVERAERDRDILNEQLHKLSITNLDLHFDNAKLQDRLSALLCPMNDHVWKDGRCVKCGRAKDD